MSYLDQDRRSRPSSVALVVLAHAAIGYALISGLAYRVVTTLPVVTRAAILPDDPPPPPPRDMSPPTARSSAEPRLTPAPREVPTPPAGEVFTVPLAPEIPLPTFLPEAPPTSAAPPPTHAGKARAAVPAANRPGWVTADDYPAQALRDGVEGVVALAVTVGADGRVSDCRVTAGSGSALLDATTCRLYARRARFTPALDDEGRAIASQRADRIRWTIPPQ